MINYGTHLHMKFDKTIIKVSNVIYQKWYKNTSLVNYIDAFRNHICKNKIKNKTKFVISFTDNI